MARAEMTRSRRRNFLLIGPPLLSNGTCRAARSGRAGSGRRRGNGVNIPATPPARSCVPGRMSRPREDATMTDRLKGKTIVVTGASSGIGKGVARALAEEGASLVLAARRTHLLRALAEEMGDAMAVTTDVSDPRAVENLAQAALGRYGRIDA